MGNENENIPDSDIKINFYFLEDIISLKLPGKTKIKELKTIYSNQKSFPANKKAKPFSLIYKGIKLDLNSSEPIYNKFKDNDTVFVVYKGENFTIEKLLEYHKNKKISKENNNNNANKNNNNNNDNNNNNKNNNNKKMDSNNIKKEEKNKNKLDENIYVEDYILKMMAKESFIQKERIEKNIKNIKALFIKDCLKEKNKHYFILAVLSNYFKTIGISTIIDKNDFIVNEDEKLFNRILFQFISNGYIFKEIYELNFKLKQKRIIQLENDENEKIKFLNNIEKSIATGYKLKNEEKINMTSYKKDQNNYIIIIFNSEKDFKKEELINIFKNDVELKNFNNIEKKLMIQSIRLSDSMLESLGDNNKDELWGKNEKRGGELYYAPKGWIKFGLKVSNCFDEGDNKWLIRNKNEWCIAYCGFVGLTKKFGQLYQNEEDIKHSGKKVGNGMYCSPFPEILEENCEIFSFEGKNYKIGFMIKVKPEKIRCPKNHNKIWVIDGTDDDFRPYGILIKNIIK